MSVARRLAPWVVSVLGATAGVAVAGPPAANGTAAATRAPSRALPSIEAALQRHGPAMATVHGAAGELGPAFFVASSGVAAAVVPAVDEVILELPGGHRRRARVLVRDPDGLALVRVIPLDVDAERFPVFPSLGLAAGAAPPAREEWLLGIDVVAGRVTPTLGGLRALDERGRWLLDLPLRPGAPVLRGDDVVGVVLRRPGATSSVAVGVARVAALAQQIAAPRAPAAP